jgi:TRAP-type mannitol/chloroaromatic compound transport system substrate-binding protein
MEGVLIIGIFVAFGFVAQKMCASHTNGGGSRSLHEVLPPGTMLDSPTDG